MNIDPSGILPLIVVIVIILGCKAIINRGDKSSRINDEVDRNLSAANRQSLSNICEVYSRNNSEVPDIIREEAEEVFGESYSKHVLRGEGRPWYYHEHADTSSHPAEIRLIGGGTFIEEDANKLAKMINGCHEHCKAQVESRDNERYCIKVYNRTENWPHNEMWFWNLDQWEEEGGEFCENNDRRW